MEWQKDITTQLEKLQEKYHRLDFNEKEEYSELISMHQIDYQSLHYDILFSLSLEQYAEEIVAFQTKDFNMKLRICNDLYKVSQIETKETALIYLSALSMSPFLEDKISRYENFIQSFAS